MLDLIENFDVDSSDWGFISLTHSEIVHEKAFLINERLWVNFDNQSGGKVALSAIKPEVSAAHYRIRPINMGASSWYSIEYTIPGERLVNAGQLVPCLDAASAQSVTLFALLRIFYKDGRSEDISSSQIELRRERSMQSFPMSLGDLPTILRNEIQTAKLIYFIEARNVDIDIYGMSLTTVPVVSAQYSVNHIERLRAAHKAGTKSLHVRSLNPQVDSLWTGETTKHRPIATEVYLDFQPDDGRKVTVARQHNGFDIDFTEANKGNWRTLEFRFSEIFNSGTITAVLHAKGRPGGSRPAVDATLVLREYEENLAWEDTNISVPLSLFPEDHSELRVIDLSPILSDKRDVHHFGLMVFFPPEAGILEMDEIDVFVFDRELV